MPTITAFEAEAKFDELLDRVSRGEEIVITRHDKPVARIVREGERNMEEVRKAVAGLRALRKEIASRKSFKPPTDKEIKAMINEGRK